MFNFEQNIPRKRYGKVKGGWHPGKIYQLSLNNYHRNKSGQYIKEDIEIMEEKFRDIIVPAFFYYNNGNPERKFIIMGKAAGLNKNYRNDMQSAFNDLLGRELMVYVVHKYKKGRIRRDQIVDFKPLPEPGSSG